VAGTPVPAVVVPVLMVVVPVVGAVGGAMGPVPRPVRPALVDVVEEVIDTGSRTPGEPGDANSRAGSPAAHGWVGGLPVQDSRRGPQCQEGGPRAASCHTRGR